MAVATKGGTRCSSSNIGGGVNIIIEVILDGLRKSVDYSCKKLLLLLYYRRRDDNQEDDDDDDDDEMIVAVRKMEIGWPTDVRHVSHVTFDRFNGFLGLPLDLHLDPSSTLLPSARYLRNKKFEILLFTGSSLLVFLRLSHTKYGRLSCASVFGVSAESMQCCYDSRGNSVPTILLLMQDRLYSQGGLKAEGIFRINPENSHSEDVRSQLNRGIVPNDIDVHCLAGLIKAWFRELPSGILDGLLPDQVLQCNTEDDSVRLVNQLKPTESALLKWSVDLMADVVEQEGFNKMNARNIAVVFAPNMTQMSDPLTALVHAVQVMNFLKTLIMKTLREREEALTGEYSPMSSHLSDDKQGMDTGCELRGPISEGDRNSVISENGDYTDEIMLPISNTENIALM